MKAPSCLGLMESIGGISSVSARPWSRRRASATAAAKTSADPPGLWWPACLNPWTASSQPALALGVNGPSAREDTGWGRFVERRKVGGRGVRHDVSTLRPLILTNLNHFPKFPRRVASGCFENMSGLAVNGAFWGPRLNGLCHAEGPSKRLTISHTAFARYACNRAMCGWRRDSRAGSFLRHRE
jgi:hypothetical protein